MISYNQKFQHVINIVRNDSYKLIGTQDILDWYNIFKPIKEACHFPPLLYKNHDQFDEIYGSIQRVYNYLSMEDLSSKAVADFKLVDLNKELELLQWLVNYEELHLDLILLHPETVSEEDLKTGEFRLNQNLNIYLKTNILKDCIEVERLFDIYYYDRINKYNLNSDELEESITPFDDNYKEISSLKHHLRGNGIVF
jgi:hypothetical protein